MALAEKGALQPHRVRSWLNPVIEDEEAFAKQVAELVELQQAAPQLAEQGVRVVSCDEKTGMQAIERLGRTPMRRGQPERVESWYRRHGTLCLIANVDLATGKVVAPTLGETRTNEDFLHHVQQTVATDPDAHWVFVVDNLNTHTSIELVRWVAERCGIADDLGKPYQKGVLRVQATRAAFLTDPAHRIRFVYTPKHCSWLNDIERWFSKLARAVLRRGSFTSKDELRRRVLEYIRYFNVVDAKHTRWRADAADILEKMGIGNSGGLN